MTGIYKIESIIKPERIYIGSSIDVNKRWKEHIRDLRAERRHSLKIQRHHNKYGLSDLVFTVILECEKEYLIKNEQYYIDLLNPYFNAQKIANSPLGSKRSQDTKDKISRAKKGEVSNRKGVRMTIKEKLDFKRKYIANKILRYEKLGIVYITAKEKITLRKQRYALKKQGWAENKKYKESLPKKIRCYGKHKIIKKQHGSKFKGVYVSIKRYKDSIYITIRAAICDKNKIINLGTFKTEEQAAIAYNKKAIELDGDKAIINEI